MNEIEQAVKVFNDGGIVIFPTDTAFGIGCRIDREDTIRRLFTLRKRPQTQAAPVLVASSDMAKKYLLPVNQKVEELMNQYWPGALTIVHSCKTEIIPKLVRGNSETLGVRMPNHSVILEVIKQIGVPILGPSANFHGYPTPYQFEDLDQELVRQVDYVLNGKCSIKNASTVIDCSVDPWKIIRQGAVYISQ